MKISKTILASLLFALAGVTSAQQTAQPARPPAQVPQAAQPLTPAQQELVARQDAEIAKAAAWVVQNVDRNNAAEVWRGASAVAKNAVTEQAFVAQLSQDRQKLGAITQRQQIAITRAVYPAGGQVPAGKYVNVAYATKFANAAQPVRELVSFHLDDDKVWRMSGYSVR
ncbi:MAG TPA: DUF4019 domain-containing protein [Pseudoxanthomonas sp.]